MSAKPTRARKGKAQPPEPESAENFKVLPNDTAAEGKRKRAKRPPSGAAVKPDLALEGFATDPAKCAHSWVLRAGKQNPLCRVCGIEAVPPKTSSAPLGHVLADDDPELADLKPLARRYQGQRFRDEQERVNAQIAFLQALGQTGVVSWACKTARIGRSTIYGNPANRYDRGWLSDPDFKAAFDTAITEAKESLEYTAWDRASNGVVTARRFRWDPTAWPEETPPEKRVGDAPGAVVISEETRAYSDGLLMFLLKKLDPSYKDRLDLTSAGQPMKALVGVDLDKMVNGDA